MTRSTLSTGVLWRRSRPLASLDRLRAVVLLGGTIRPTSLQSSVGRSVLDLPVDEEMSILDYWRREAEQLASAHHMQRVELKVMLDHISPMPRSGLGAGRAVVTIERDPSSLRGTGGLLHDLAQRWDDDDLLLVGSAGQLLMLPLVEAADALAARCGDVSVVAHRNGTPSGLMLVRCGCLRDLPPVGFVDMKEQALPRIARRHDVRVVSYDRPTGMPLRTLSGYIDALRSHHRLEAVGEGFPDDDWKATFALVENGATVCEGARIHDSVVLRGATVGRGAAVVRSVVCAGVRVSAHSMTVDEVASEDRGE